MRLHAIFAALLACALTAIATAQTTYTWTGLAADSNFANPANWQGNVAPGGLSTDSLVFPGLPVEQQGEEYVFANLNTPSSTGNITFSGNYYSFYLGGTGPLTLHGNVTATSNVGNITLPVILAAGNHVFSGSNYIFQTGNVSGTGGITLNSGTLALFGASNTYSGGTVVNGGNLIVSSNSSLGSGSIILNGGALAGNSTPNLQISKNFVLGSNVTFSAGMSSGNFYIGNGDGSDITPATGVTTVNLNLGISSQSVYLTGDMLDGSAATTYTFSRDSISYNAHSFVLTGSNNYTGGTLVKSGGAVNFEETWAIPAAGLITAEADGYVGINNPLLHTALLSKLDPATFAGVIGFNVSDIYTGAINLTNFSASGGTASIGTMNQATLTGLITPSSTSNQYRFQSSGTLFLDGINPLSGANGLVSRSLPESNPGVLVLQQSVANTYTGATLADGASIIFNSAGSMSAGSAISLANGGYVSVTNTSGLTLASLIAKVAAGTVTNGGVIGYDNSANLGGDSYDDIYSLPVDFSSLTSDVYLGSAAGSGTIAFTNTISTANGNTGDYFLTGYGYGEIAVSSQLTGNKALHVGVAQGGSSTVYLDHVNNTYSGGTILNAGSLIVAAAGSLGSGPITADLVDNSYSLYLEGPNNSTLANNITLNTGDLSLYWGVNSTFSGVISGAGSLAIYSDLILSGTNSYSGGTSIPAGTLVTATTNTALGSGSLSLLDGATMQFTSAAPQIGSLLVGGTYFYDDDGVYERSSILKFATSGNATLTINQTEDGDFEGAIGQGTGVGSLVKNGSGTLIIGGLVGQDNDVHTPYSGGTTINAGSLIAGSPAALGTGTITLNGGELGTSVGVTLTNAIAFGTNGGTLGGNGTFAVPITAGTNVKLSPGASPGTMTFAAGLTLAAGGSLAVEVQSATGAAGAGYDLVNISSGLLDITATAGSPFTILLTSLDALGDPGSAINFSSSTGYTWMIFQGNSVSGINGYDASKFTIDASGFTNALDSGVFSLTLGVNAGNPALYLNFSPVPEPSTYTLLATGLVTAFFGYRRRRRA